MPRRVVVWLTVLPALLAGACSASYPAPSAVVPLVALQLQYRTATGDLLVGTGVHLAAFSVDADGVWHEVTAQTSWGSLGVLQRQRGPADDERPVRDLECLAGRASRPAARLGTYEGATRTAFRAPGTPGIDISGAGRGCNRTVGAFIVREADYTASGQIRQFWATFEQQCEGNPAPMRGDIRVTNLPPVPPPPGSVACMLP